MFRYVLLSAALAAPAASAQPGGPPPADALLPVLLPYVGDGNVRAELSLTEEQVKSLTDHRQKQWDEVYALHPARASATEPARGAATLGAFRRVLKPDQLKRARELAAQFAWGESLYSNRPNVLDPGRVPASVLARRPELAAALRLTDLQQKIVAGARAGFRYVFGPGSPPMVYLTPGQTETAKSLLGAPFQKTTYPAVDARSEPFPRADWDRLARTALAPDVRAELKISAKQRTELAALPNVGAPRRGFRGSTSPVSPAARDRIDAILLEEARAALRTILQPEQLTRLEQIHRRASWHGGRDESSLLYHPDAEAAMNLGRDQLKRFEAADAEFARAVAATVHAGKHFEKTGEAIRGAARVRDEAYFAALTPAQSAKFKELFGEPFGGDATPDAGFEAPGGFPGGPGGSSPGRSERGPREYAFGNYVNELSLAARNSDLAEELKLTEADLKKLRYAEFELAEQFGVSSRRWSGSAITNPATQAFVARALKDNLNPEQARRFREIMLQYRERVTPAAVFGGSAGVRSAVSYPGVADELKLTEEQKAKLLQGTPAKSVLTDDQKAALTVMMGEPYKHIAALAGRLGIDPRPQRELRFGRYTDELTLLGRDAGLAEELKLTDEQLKKFRYAAFEYSEGFGNSGFGAPTVAANPGAQVFIAKALREHLKPEQAKRFREIMLQLQEGPSSRTRGFAPSDIRSAVIYPGVAEEVKLTAQQKDKLLDGAPPAEVLTGEQKSAIRAMLGQPYKDLGALASRDSDFGGRGGFSGGDAGVPARAPIPPAVLSIPWDGLRLRPEQAGKLAEAANRYTLGTLPEPRASSNGGFGGTVAPSASRVAAAVDAFNKELAAILTPEQQKRLDQLALQQLAAGKGLRAALTRPDVVRRMDLTAEQLRKMRAAEDAARRTAGLVESAMVDPDTDDALRVWLQDRLDVQIARMLTAKQKAAWKELAGEPDPAIKKSGLTSADRLGSLRG
jgi:Spy/CpxP family protein refolding chaperone